jgi:hypothetical protein
MSNTLVPNGKACNFGFRSNAGDYGITDGAGLLSGMLLQSADQESGADVEDVRALQGDKQARNWYDLHDKAMLRFVVSAAGGQAAARAATTRAPWSPGNFVVITQCQSQPDMVASNWEVQAGTKIVGDITKSAEITIMLEKRPAITGPQGA